MNHFVWQDKAWKQLQKIRMRLPHAILLHGPEGTGKTIFAQQFAQSLLCEQPQESGHACDVCNACGWFKQHNHPDYRSVKPEVLDQSTQDVALSESDKTLSKEIKIDQIRDLFGFIHVSAHRHGRRVVLLYPAETLNAIAANGILKTLEEPPAETTFLLISHNVARLLPTIRSRCYQLAMPIPSHAQALTWLQQQNVQDADVWLAEQSGAPLLAYVHAQSESHAQREIFLQHLVRPSIEEALKCAEQLHKASLMKLIGWQQRWLYDLLSFKLCGIIRYYPRYAVELTKLTARLPIATILQGLKKSNQRRAIAEHPLSTRLFIEEMMLDYAAMFAEC